MSRSNRPRPTLFTLPSLERSKVMSVSSTGVHSFSLKNIFDSCKFSCTSVHHYSVWGKQKLPERRVGMKRFTTIEVENHISIERSIQISVSPSGCLSHRDPRKKQMVEDDWIKIYSFLQGRDPHQYYCPFHYNHCTTTTTTVVYFHLHSSKEMDDYFRFKNFVCRCLCYIYFLELSYLLTNEVQYSFIPPEYCFFLK